MSVRAASSNNIVEPKYDVLVSSMTYIAHNSLVFYSCILHQHIKPGSDATIGERSNFKKFPTHTQDHVMHSNEGESAVYVPNADRLRKR